MSARAKSISPMLAALSWVKFGVQITQITDEMPRPDEIERVRARLADKGWPLEDPRDVEETE